MRLIFYILRFISLNVKIFLRNETVLMTDNIIKILLIITQDLIVRTYLLSRVQQP